MVLNFRQSKNGCLRKLVVTSLFCAMIIIFDMDPSLSTTKVALALSYGDSVRRVGYSIIEVVPLQDETEPEKVHHHDFSEPITNSNNVKSLSNVSHEDNRQQNSGIFHLNDTATKSKAPRNLKTKTRCKCKSIGYILNSNI